MKKIIPKKKPIANKIPSSAVAKQPNVYLYRDPKFGFTLRLPRSWKTYTVVRRRTNLDDAEYGVFFSSNIKEKYMKTCYPFLYSG